MGKGRVAAVARGLTLRSTLDRWFRILPSTGSSWMKRHLPAPYFFTPLRSDSSSWDHCCQVRRARGVAFIRAKYFCACERICSADLVPTCSCILNQFWRPQFVSPAYSTIASSNRLCSSSVQFRRRGFRFFIRMVLSTVTNDIPWGVRVMDCVQEKMIDPPK